MVTALATAAGVPYFVYVSDLYNIKHTVPTKALVWLHGCFGKAEDEAETVSVAHQSWITISVGGETGKDSCWDVTRDREKVLAALDDVKTRINIDASKIVLGGYSSGGDLAYRLAYESPKAFAGVLVENTSPFRDTGLTQKDALAPFKAPSSFKPNVTHVAHGGDATYPIDGVRAETQALVEAGFHLKLIVVPGNHWDGDDKPGFGTVFDRRKYLLPWLNAGWTSPQ